MTRRALSALTFAIISIPALASSASAADDIDKCQTLRPQVESLIGTLTAAPARARAPMQDMPSLTCRFRSSDGWLVVTFIPGRDRGEFERMLALVNGSARVDAVADVAFSEPPNPDQAPAGATIAAYTGGTQFMVQAASGAKSADELRAAITDLVRMISADDRLLHGIDREAGENQHLQGGG